MVRGVECVAIGNITLNVKLSCVFGGKSRVFLGGALGNCTHETVHKYMYMYVDGIAAQVLHRVFTMRSFEGGKPLQC